MRAAVVGATGYIGMQCVALLERHPDVELVRVLARSTAGSRFCDVVPGSEVALVIESGFDPGDVDVVVAALPHTVAASHAAGWLAAGALVVDMSADFRLRDVAEYERQYRVSHPAPELCADAVYALPELHCDDIRQGSLLAAPGCYPTAALLATVPAVRAGLVEPEIVVDAKSGVSGAGRSPSLGTLFSEVNESVHAYGVGGHRHRSEMVQELTGAGEGAAPSLTFVAHLVPMTRGILATAYLRPRPGVTESDLHDAYRDFCEGRPFLRLAGAPPATKSVVGTNLAAIHTGWQEGTAVVTCAIDNLLKGAAGQGIQAMNLRLGLDERAGLERPSSWP